MHGLQAPAGGGAGIGAGARRLHRLAQLGRCLGASFAARLSFGGAGAGWGRRAASRRLEAACSCSGLQRASELESWPAAGSLSVQSFDSLFISTAGVRPEDLAALEAELRQLDERVRAEGECSAERGSPGRCSLLGGAPWDGHMQEKGGWGTTEACWSRQLGGEFRSEGWHELGRARDRGALQHAALAQGWGTAFRAEAGCAALSALPSGAQLLQVRSVSPAPERPCRVPTLQRFLLRPLPCPRCAQAVCQRSCCAKATRL